MTCNNKQVELLMKYKKQKPEVNISSLANKADMSIKTARKYIKLGKLPSELKSPRVYRTRTDPFEKHKELIEQMLRKAPDLQAKTLLYYLMEQFPEEYDESHLRTLQRRIRELSAINGEDKEIMFLQKIEPGQQSQSDWVILNCLNITISNKPFEHRLFHFILPYSQWEYGMVCYSESFETLSKGFIQAVNKLGGTLKDHRTDNLSAATKKFGNSRTFTDKWEGLLKHYNVNPSRNNPGKSNENGSVEKSHDLIKNAINQHLLLRGNRNFNSITEYENFINMVIEKRNNGRTERLKEELPYLQTLPKRNWNDPAIMNVKVCRSSTINILGVVYSVPSRLISFYLRAYIYRETIDLYYGTKLILTLNRSESNNIDYRHIIDSLVRKPGAFAKYKFHSHLFPLFIFRKAYDKLIKVNVNNGHKEYLRILQIAKCYGEREVVEALEKCEANKIIPKAKNVEEIVRQPVLPPCEAKVLKPDLKEYNSLYSSTYLEQQTEGAVTC